MDYAVRGEIITDWDSLFLQVGHSLDYTICYVPKFVFRKSLTIFTYQFDPFRELHIKLLKYTAINLIFPGLPVEPGKDITHLIPVECKEIPDLQNIAVMNLESFFNLLHFPNIMHIKFFGCEQFHQP